MKQRESITKIMTRNVFSIQKNDSLREAASIIQKERIHHLPVLDGNHIVGIISSTDLNRLTFGSLYNSNAGTDLTVLDSLSIEQIMTHSPTVVQSSYSIKEVAAVFAEAYYHCLPVVENDKLVGIVTTTDLIKFLLDQY